MATSCLLALDPQKAGRNQNGYITSAVSGSSEQKTLDGNISPTISWSQNAEECSSHGELPSKGPCFNPLTPDQQEPTGTKCHHMHNVQITSQRFRSGLHTWENTTYPLFGAHAHTIAQGVNFVV